MAHLSSDTFHSLRIAVLTVSDTRTLATDTSGQTLIEGLELAGHALFERAIVPDDIWQIRARLSVWIADPLVQAVLITGGTGFTARDNTPQAVMPLLDKSVDGFGELFRQVSLAEIGTSTVQSRALAGISNGTLCAACRDRRARVAPPGTRFCWSNWIAVRGRAILSRTSNNCRNNWPAPAVAAHECLRL
jgi:molybdenum cofactor biosynthesis protein B